MAMICMFHFWQLLYIFVGICILTATVQLISRSYMWLILYTHTSVVYATATEVSTHYITPYS